MSLFPTFQCCARRQLGQTVISCLILLLMASCGSTRFLKKDEYLLRKNTIKLHTSKTYSDKSELRDGLHSVILQQPNTYLFGIMPFKTWGYNLRHKHFEKDTSNFPIRSKLIEKPVVFDRGSIASSVKQMQNLLLNQGYFNAKVTTRIDTISKKKLAVTYHVDAKDEYLVDTIHYSIDSSELQMTMQKIWEDNSLVQHALPYSNGLLSLERSQMVNLAKENGFYKFNTDNIQFELDTMAQRKLRNKRSVVESAADVLVGKIKNSRPSVSITAIVKEQEHYETFDQYHFKHVFVYPEYSDNEDFLRSYNQELRNKGIIYRFKSEQPLVRRGVVQSKIAIKEGALYKQSDYNKTLLQLNDLSIFNYARIFITEDTLSEDKDKHYLDAHVVLSPGKQYEFNTNFELSGGDLYLAGSALNASVINKNLFRGANQLSISGSYGFELNQTKNFDQKYFERFYVMTQNFGLNTKLIFPNFLSPVKLNQSNTNAPKTVFSLGVNILDRFNYFRIRTLNSSFGYVWKSGRWSTWQLNPLFFNSLRLNNISDSFQVRLDQVQAIRNSYQENFILGENIEFIHNTEGKVPHKHHFFRIGLEESGLLLGAANDLRNSIAGKGLGFNYANYLRVDFDMRQYYNRRNSKVVLRMHGGLGMPYGPSRTLPYIKQYFVGGPYSIRGWGPRLLGPGSFLNPALQNTQDRLFIDQSGDIKLEWNAEYRFRMMQLFAGAIGLHGAVFADAGNIWLAKADENMPGAEFRFNKLYQDIGLSTGAGLRADIGGFLILRADWAFALKKPYETSNAGWVLDEIDFGSKSWRGKNINLNIGIGMPF